jgi:hypothetical protein
MVFRTRYKYFEYYILLFGLTNTPAIFQSYINQALISLINITYMIYLDNILIFSENPTNYIKTIREVLERLKENKFFANLKKYDFSTNTIEFLGFIVGPNGIEIDLSRV